MSSAVELAHNPYTGVQDLETALSSLHQASKTSRYGYTDRLALFDALAKDLLRPASSVRRRIPAEGLAYLATFLQSGFLDKLIAREVAVKGALDSFTKLEDRKSLRLAPRGVVCHWVAGNVPLLAVFSFAISALLGNSNALRLSSRQDDVISPFLDAMRELGPVGAEVADQTLVVRFDSADQKSHQLMSGAANARIAWGGKEAVSAIRGLPADWDCEDVVFGPRSSMAVVDPEAMDAGAIRRLATDIAVFDQQACSSPQSIFVKARSESSELQGFIREFCDALDAATSSMPRHPLDFSETYRIELDRARIRLGGGSIKRDSATRWTVAVVETPNDTVQCANRFVQLVPFETFEAVYPLIPLNIQTIVTQLNEQDLAEFTEQAALTGVCRFPVPGEGNNFENPWDGVGLVSRLTRSILRTDAR